MDVTLSVVVPVRNAADYLPDALASLRRNQRADFEFVVVDDGSDDDTPAVIAAALPDTPGLRTFRHERAVGLADARNAGLDAARGRYLMFMDGDDWLRPGYLSELVAAIDRLGCDFVRVDHVQATGRRRVLHPAPEGRRDVVLRPQDAIAPANRRTMVDYPYAWAGIFRRGLGELLRFPSGLHTAEDRPWIWRLHREAQSFAVVSLCGLFYRREVTASLTRIGDERQLDVFRAYADVFGQVRGEPVHLAKAVRQFLGVLAHHVATDRLEPRLQGEFRQRARALLATLPPQLLSGYAPSRERAALLAPLLPAGVRLGHQGAEA